MIWPREMFVRYGAARCGSGEEPLEKTESSVAPRRRVVDFVSGVQITRWSRFWERKVCSEDLSLGSSGLWSWYQAVGIVPSGSPVLGTMKPSSRRDSGVGRGEEVYAMTSMPIADARRATLGGWLCQFGLFGSVRN